MAGITVIRKDGADVSVVIHGGGNFLFWGGKRGGGGAKANEEQKAAKTPNSKFQSPKNAEIPSPKGDGCVRTACVGRGRLCGFHDCEQAIRFLAEFKLFLTITFLSRMTTKI